MLEHFQRCVDNKAFPSENRVVRDVMRWTVAAVSLVVHLATAETPSAVGIATVSAEASIPASLTALPSETDAVYPTNYSPRTLTGSASGTSTSSATLGSSNIRNATATTSSTSQSSKTHQETTLHGSGSSSAPRPTSTLACNGHSEFCPRRYSNVTYVMAHNSPFVVENNAASNQAFHVTTQLNDGIRGLQFETHKPNASSPMMLCHSSCDELNVGPLEDYLVTVREWLDQNRFEVITILMGNDDFVEPTNYTAPFTNSGMLDYLYIPNSVPMGLDGWPTLSEMITSNKRVVAMLDYKANQQQVPWLLEQWDYLFQTPFSPTNPEFPCTAQRPPNQPRNVSADRLYVANHNLNLPIKIPSLDLNILVPYWPQLDNTNANFTEKEGAAGTMIDNCTAMWNRPPNFLLVDYYNYGNFNGSTLAAGARANNVSYDVASCCGTAGSSSGTSLRESTGSFSTLVGVVFVICSIIYVV